MSSRAVTMNSRMFRAFIAIVVTAGAVIFLRCWWIHTLEYGIPSLQLSYLTQRRCSSTGGPCDVSSLDCSSLQDWKTEPELLLKLKRTVASPSSRGGANKNCTLVSGRQEVRHIAYVKIHKTGSTTLQNVFFRFGLRRDLTFVLPRALNYLNYIQDTASIRKSLVLPPPRNRTFDLICCHVTFNYTVFRQYVQPDTVFLASVREPIARMKSAFYFYRHPSIPYLRRVHGQDPFLAFLNHTHSFEPEQAFQSVTNNRMAQDLGFLDLDSGEEAFHAFLQRLDSVLDLVLVAELFDQSLVLLRRRLGWGIRDVLYVKKNVLKYSGPKDSSSIDGLPDYLREKTLSFLKWDVLLYRHYRRRLMKQIAEAGEDFEEEVEFLKSVLKQVQVFCSGHEQLTTVQRSQWNEAFYVTRIDCYFMNMDENTFFRVLRHRHLDQLRQQGGNVAFMTGIPESGVGGDKLLKELILTVMSYVGTVLGE